MRNVIRLIAFLPVILILTGAGSPAIADLGELTVPETYDQMTAHFNDERWEEAYDLCVRLVQEDRTYQDTFFYFCYLDSVCRLIPEGKYSDAYAQLELIPEGKFEKTAGYKLYLSGLLLMEAGDYPAALASMDLALKAGNIEAYDQIRTIREFEKYAAVVDAAHTDPGTAKPADLKEARSFFMPYAQNGDSMAAYYVGMTYSSFLFKQNAYGEREATGRPMSGSNDAAAFEWFTKAADAGNSAAMFMAGLSRQWGRGCPANKKTAGRWFEKAAEAGNTEAMVQAWLYETKENHNDAAAFKWALIGAQAGSVHCMCLTGDAYYSGTGISRNLKEALAWYRKALEQDGWDSAVYLVRVEELKSAVGE